MKEIKAYIRRSTVNKVVEALQQAGAPGMTIVEIHPVGDGYDPNYFEPRFEEVMQRYKLWHIVKLELVCADHDAERFVGLVREQCCSGAKGDGMIFMSEVSMAMRIRDGARGEAAL